MISIKELNALIETFVQKHRPHIRADLANYNNIHSAATSKGKNGKKHQHQYRISPAILENFAKKINAETTRLKQARSFDEIYKIVESCKIRGIGPLAIYDTAVRIGHIYDVEPVEIYLQQGAHWGASAFGINKNKASKQQFTAITTLFNQLTPHEIECFLCLNHKVLNPNRCQQKQQPQP